MGRTVLTPTRRHGAALLAAFGALAVYVSVVGVAGWELSVTRWFHDLPDGLAFVLRPPMELGNRLVAVLVALAVGARWGRRCGGTVLVATLAVSVAALLVKAALSRPRVTAADLGAAPRDVVGGWSFPSGHTSVSFATIVAVILVVKPGPRVVALLLGIAALTGTARMYVGVQLPA